MCVYAMCACHGVCEQINAMCIIFLNVYACILGSINMLVTVIAIVRYCIHTREAEL